jgi:FPC/CPF motif-containing protein YcgG
MILTIAIVFFVLGFGAAIAGIGRPSKPKENASELLRSIRPLYRKIRSIFNVQSEKGTVLSIADEKNVVTFNLLTKEQVESQFELSSWQSLAYNDFKSVIMAKQTGAYTFPCVYATMGYCADEHRYVFLKSDNPAEPQNIRLIAPALHEYLSLSPSLGPNTSLVIIGAPSEKSRTVEEYNDTFWHMLRGLRMTDPKPWPHDVPETVESERWTFCYNGEPIFPVMLTPAHSRRWSRHMSVPVIALQPKSVLDKLLSTPEERNSATGKVRRLLDKYDQVAISPDLTSYGQPGTSEARQLCLLDENKTAQCPYTNFDA